MDRAHARHASRIDAADWPTDDLGGRAVVRLARLLAVRIARPRDLPEAVAAVPAAAGIALALGLISPADAEQSVIALAPTIGFLAAVLVIAHLVEADGVFRWLGAPAGRPQPRATRSGC